MPERFGWSSWAIASYSLCASMWTLGIPAPGRSGDEPGQWVLTSTRDDIRKDQDTATYGQHKIGVTEDPSQPSYRDWTTVQTSDAWDDLNGCSGSRESNCAWSEIPRAMAPGSKLRITTRAGVKGQQTCSERRAAARVSFYVNDSQKMSNSLEYWTSQAPPPPQEKVAEYEVAQGRAGDELVICLVVQGPGGLFYKYHSYAWTGMAGPVAECVWEGTWTSNLGDVVLRREGDKVTGTYPHDQGRIEGVVVGNTLTGLWAEAPSYESPDDSGDLEITLSADCQSFSARWRYGSSGEWKADWAGQRSK